MLNKIVLILVCFLITGCDRLRRDIDQEKLDSIAARTIGDYCVSKELDCSNLYKAFTTKDELGDIILYLDSEIHDGILLYKSNIHHAIRDGIGQSQIIPFGRFAEKQKEVVSESTRGN